MVTKSHFRIVNGSLINPDSTLVLVGTALDGPSHVPFLLNDNFPTETVLGRSPLSKAYNLARKTGLQKIILYRLNGSHSTGVLTFEGDDPIDVLSFRSVAANDAYNDIEMTCGPDKLTVIGSDGTTRHYFFSSYPTSNALADAINLDAEFGLVEFTAYTIEFGFEMNQFVEDVPVFLSGGSTGAELIPDRGTGEDISSTIASLKEQLKQALFGSSLEDQENYVLNSDLSLLDYGVISLVDMFHDDGGDFSNILARFCYGKSNELKSGTIGVIGVKPIFDVTDQAISDKYISLLGLAPTAKSAGAAEVGVENAVAAASPYAYLQVVIGDAYTTNVFTSTPEPISLSYSYGALQALLASSTNMTNKGMTGISKVNYEFSKENIDSLLANGYISIVGSIRKGIVPYQAVTAVGGKSNSLLKNPAVVRVSHVVTRRIAEYLDAFIGEATTPRSRRNLDTGLYNMMKVLLEEDKLIRDYTVEVNYQNFNSEVAVKVSYVPLSYIETVTTVVEMPFTREVII